MSKITRGESGNGYDRYSISVPPRIGRMIPADTEFDPELTEDGILFRRRVSAPEYPTWATGRSPEKP